MTVSTAGSLGGLRQPSGHGDAPGEQRHRPVTVVQQQDDRAGAPAREPGERDKRRIRQTNESRAQEFRGAQIRVGCASSDQRLKVLHFRRIRKKPALYRKPNAAPRAPV